jgi:hypothetical protein
MPRVFPLQLTITRIDEIGSIASGLVQVTTGSVASKVYHTTFVEYPFGATIASGTTLATGSVSVTQAGEIKAVRTYGTTTGYTLVLRDTFGEIYRFEGTTSTTLVDSTISVPIAPKTLTVIVSLPSPAAATQSFTGIVCVQTRVFE